MAEEVRQAVYRRKAVPRRMWRVDPLGPKLERLTSILRKMPGALVAYSGGADSALLAEAAHRTLGELSEAAIADSPSLPRRELAAAERLAGVRGWRYRVVRTAELEDERYAANPQNRCYFCKSALFDVVGAIARGRGWEVLLGTNLDDLGDHRPGQTAAVERGVRHPLVEAGLTKEEVREASRRWGLPTAEKPASACLASRFAYGVRVTAGGLERVERAENLLFDRGFEVVRVRDLGDDRARVEVGAGEVDRLARMAGEVTGSLREFGFSSVTIDERGYRRGALNEGTVWVETPRPVEA
jgi:uncharacterized protein